MTHIFLNSKRSDAYGSSATIQKGDYDGCKLFEKYTHRSHSPIKPWYIYLYKDEKKKDFVTLYINGKYYSQQLKYEEVYFNRYQENFLILVLYYGDSLSARYFTHSEFNKSTGSSKNLTDLPVYDRNKFLDELIRENDVTNKAVTYQIDKQTKEYNSNIELQTGRDDPSPGFTKYNHRSTAGKKITFVLYKYHVPNQLDNQQLNVIDEMQNKEYNGIHVFFSGKIDIPLLVCFINSDKLCYQYKVSNDHDYFEKLTKKYDELTGDNKKELKETLQNAEFTLLNTVQLLVSNKKKYQKKEIKSKTGREPTVTQPETIEVSERENCTELKKIDCKLYEHNLSNIQVKQGTSVRLKLFISIGDVYKEIELFDGGETIQNYVNYKRGDKLLVYFFNEDPRPLLIIYDNSVYKPSSLKNYTAKWIRVIGINNEMCSYDNPPLRDKLKKILDMLNPVKLEQPRAYKIHEQTQYPQIEIDVTNDSEKCYTKYTHSPKQGYILGNLMYGSNTIKDKGNSQQPISAGRYDKVTVYYYDKDSELSNPLMIELELKSNNVTKTFFMLVEKNEYQFERIADSIESQDKLLEKLFNINKEINKDKSPSESDCKDVDDYYIPIIVGVTVPVGLGGGGIAAYVFRGEIATCWKSRF